ncbi:pitrilysin family protein [Sphingomonas daechungensis]|uniref:Insulinase family protein n=1 Tax=Sphingomonas daechungensis TaxID=1176646 RepID=A0ABX6T2V5_9SPHN|nr:pitrilysin family protein [Sphingomonas daechungensis]QNP43985.1 insulinase family protein [Sphingomonas daechungensis]
MNNKNRIAVLLASASLLAACATAPQTAVAPAAPPAAAAPAPSEPAPVSALVQEVAIPHTSFKLANGLTVIVHEDHKAPIVAVSTWYNVGSKDEPKGKTGFAHLFEHLMFNGSDNLPGDYFTYLQQIGATDYNGTTWFDRTNYFETVPKAALDRALFMESDRMGYLLGAVTQEKLDNQRGVVQNEKRQGDNQPGGLTEYEVLGNLFPEGHPYHHSTIGSMADLDAASLATVKEWFIDKYGPNNAVLVLAGDITAAEAQPLVEKYFGAIKAGPVNTPAAADVPTLAAPKSIVMKDRVAAVQIQKHWAVPGLQSDQLAALDIGGSILGGLASSRLDKILVRDEKLAVGVSAGLQPFQRIGMFEVDATVKPGVDPAGVEKRLDEIMAEFIANGPTEDEVRRAATREVSGRIRGLEQVGGFGGKAVALAEGEVFVGDSDFYKRTLDAYAALTPADVKAALQQWLTRPAFTIRLEPGDRPPYEETKFKPKTGKTADIKTPKVKREIPAVSGNAPLDFPAVQHTTLSNGIKVSYAQRTTVPVTQIALGFDAGYAADAPNGRGLQNMTLSLLDEGAAGKSSQQIAEDEERLGAQISAGGGADTSNVTLSALSANLGPSLDLLADLVQRPDFNAPEVERVRTQILTGIAQEQKTPERMAGRALPSLLYGPTHPYAAIGSGDPAAVKAFSREDLVGFQQRWLRPDNLEIFVVSNLPLADVQQQLEQRFGTWTAPAVAKGEKVFTAPPARPNAQRIVLIDRPGSPQSIIVGGQVTPVDPRGEMAALTLANDVLGVQFLSRINMDLRETKGWSYGVRGTTQLNAKVVPYVISAPVQADRTGDSIKALQADIREFLTTKPVTDEEFERNLANRVSQLPGSFETSGSVLGAMQTNALYGRPDNYYELLADKYRSQSKASLDAALRAAVDPNGFVWVVVGDAAKVKPQLAKLGLPVEEMQPK